METNTLDILLVNDDGFEADGINVMFEALTEAGYDVTFVAPKEQQSGTGTLINVDTIFQPTEVVNFEENKWYVDASPVVTTWAGLDFILDGNKPDLVISGINEGANIGSNIAISSGTVSAAATAIQRGIPAIAVSAGTGSDEDKLAEAYDIGADFIIDIIQQLETDDYPGLLPDGVGLNVNIPTEFPEGIEEITGIEFTQLDETSTIDLSFGELPEAFGEGAGVLINLNSPIPEEQITNIDSEGEQFLSGDITVTAIDGDWSSGATVRDSLSERIDAAPENVTAEPLNILITNDDGFAAAGIEILYEILTAAGHHVTLVAPKEQQSGKGTVLDVDAIFQPTEVVNFEENKWYVDAAPRTTTWAGLDFILNEKPDLVISGINEGENIGPGGAVSSGTVSAAVTALLRDVPAIAISAGIDFVDETLVNQAYEIGADYITNLIAQLQATQGNDTTILPEGIGLSINIPVRFPTGVDEIQGVKFTSTSDITPFNIDFGELPTGGAGLRFSQVELPSDTEIDPTSEGGQFLSGFITVTPIDGSWNAPEPLQAEVQELISPLLSTPEEMPVNLDRQTVTHIELLGEVTFPTGFTFENTEVGGLSSIVYDANNRVYYSIADDRSQINPARFYTFSIKLDDGSLDEGDINFEAVTTLLNTDGEPFPENSLDPEGIALTENQTLYISSEGNTNDLINPFINEFSLDGELLDELSIPEKFLPTADQTAGIRNNLAFESLTISPDNRFLYTATENALFQDSPAADIETESLSRILQYDLETGEPVAEFVYEVGEVPDIPEPEDGFRTNGLVELLATDNNGSFLALERAFSAGVGNTVKLYEVQIQGALEVSSLEDLFWEEEGIPFEIDPAVQKELLIDFEADFGITPDNLEGIALGPVLPDGRQSLIVVSDNNFSDTQTTQFIALALEFDSLPAAQPVLETPYTIDDEDAPEGILAGDSDDPAIWINPENPEQSLVISTLKDGGLVTFDLNGEIIEEILPAPFGEIRYNNVDLVYNFELGNDMVDLAVASDRENDTLVIWTIDPETRQLTNVTADNILETIFGVDDGEQTAYGLAAYKSPVSGKSYAFVTQASNNQFAQLELIDNGSGSVDANLIRTIELPTPSGDLADSQSEAIVVDQELGFVYLAIEGEVGILKFQAEPDAGDDFEVVYNIEDDILVPDLEGLILYYGDNGEGYLIASSQGDSSYGLFDRSGSNEFLGQFIIAGNGDIDQVNETDGFDLTNVALGSAYPNGLFVVHDGANDPQSVVENDEELENNSTNFKFVPWENVANAFPNPLLIDPTSYDPRHPNTGLIAGTAEAETLEGTDADDLFNAGGGNDTVAGGFGNDLIYGSFGDDILRGDDNSRSPGGTLGGDDIIYGNAGDDRIGGKGGNDQLFGGSENDQLWGDDGDDILSGGLGNDTLTGDNFSGSQGSDIFVLGIGEGTDTIVDFEVGIDLIQLIGDLSFSQLSFSQQGGNTVISFEDETLALLENITPSNLNEASFITV
jgi:5'/3'-nucleotidase SurE